MPRSPEDNQQIKDARREDILRAATRVFAKKGFGDAKISDVAKEAGLSHGLVYHYFENKDAVLKAILEDKVARAREAMEEDVSRTGTSLERIRASLRSWLDRVKAEPETSILITRALVEGAMAPDVRAMMRDHMRESYQSAIARIAEGQSLGEIGAHATSEELASTLMCFMRGLALSKMIDYGIPFTVPSVDTIARLLVANPILDTQPTAAAGKARSPRGPRPRARKAAPSAASKPTRKASR